MRRVLLFTLLLAGCAVELEHGLDERQANQVTAVLDEAGISAEKHPDEGRGESWKIVVPRSEAARAFGVLEAHDLPKTRDRGLGESFPASSFLPSAVEEQARLEAALAVELERTLETMPQVSVARVHLALPPGELVPGDAPRVRPTASVLLKSRGAQPVAVAEVQKLVAGAVPSLEPADVTVLVTAAPAESRAPLARFGPLQVARESRSTLATLAASGLMLILLLALGLVFAALRLYALRRAPRS